MERGLSTLRREGRVGDTGLSFHVPSALVAAAHLEAGMVFRPEITDEGILFRPVDPMPMDDPRPAWRR